jgi:hypothetical protein
MLRDWRSEMKRTSGRVAALLIVGVATLAASVPNWGAASIAAGAEAKEALPPLAWTTHASSIGPNGALLLGEFNPRGHRTVVQFQFGRTMAYGRITPTYPEEEWFGNEVSEEEEIAECLRPQTTYHYRIVAKSKFGTAYGQDRTFRTRAGPPPRRHGCE